MRNVIFNRICIKFIAIFVLLLIMVLPFFKPNSISVRCLRDSDFVGPPSAETRMYRGRYNLLTKATDYVGVDSPKKAAELWASGLALRSAAMQYVVFTKELKDKYSEHLDSFESNWVTGQSSPSVQRFIIYNVDDIDEYNARVDLIFEIGSYHGGFKFYPATLYIIKEDDFWRISKIDAHREVLNHAYFPCTTNNSQCTTDDL